VCSSDLVPRAASHGARDMGVGGAKLCRSDSCGPLLAQDSSLAQGPGVAGSQLLWHRLLAPGVVWTPSLPPARSIAILRVVGDRSRGACCPPSFFCLVCPPSLIRDSGLDRAILSSFLVPLALPVYRRWSQRLNPRPQAQIQFVVIRPDCQTRPNMIRPKVTWSDVTSSM